MKYVATVIWIVFTDVFSIGGVISAAFSISNLIASHIEMTPSHFFQMCLDYYHRFYHIGLDNLMRLVCNAFHLRAFYVSESKKDFLMLMFLGAGFILRLNSTMLKYREKIVLMRQKTNEEIEFSHIVRRLKEEGMSNNYIIEEVAHTEVAREIMFVLLTSMAAHFCITCMIVAMFFVNGVAFN